ncbi:4-(cytidine 5'-diphospho)-2-C-methyl-D-erythritol kinase [Gammaproteobacteria bacterium 45_16_T64]|nr:4-(cytidine 5'-diphospho)-2-C-methyl-D-erythritol kinase [Gammaproteobacteria bacterium 45_16_T64]
MPAPSLFQSPAKLNLFLHITGQREDGYHNLQTVFQFLDVHDLLSFENTESEGNITLSPSIPGLPDSENLIYRAAQLLKKKTQCPLGAHINIKKRLPMGGGLGGGSSNAATTLVALNQLWKLDLPLHELKALGLTLGADVPIFIHGKSAWAEGIGEVLSPISPPENWYLLATPNCHVDTAQLFRDKQLTRNTKPITMRAFLDGAGHNDFEAVAKKNFPLINKTLELLNNWGDARLTGTGACCFCPLPNKESGLLALQELPKALSSLNLETGDLNVILTKGRNGSPLYESALLTNKGSVT